MEVKQVNRATHYSVGGIETLDFIRAKLTEEQFEGFCMGTAILYLSRANHKGAKVEDVHKAVDFLHFLLDYKYGMAP